MFIHLHLVRSVRRRQFLYMTTTRMNYHSRNFLSKRTLDFERAYAHNSCTAFKTLQPAYGLRPWRLRSTPLPIMNDASGKIFSCRKPWWSKWSALLTRHRTVKIPTCVKWPMLSWPLKIKGSLPLVSTFSTSCHHNLAALFKWWDSKKI